MPALVVFDTCTRSQYYEDVHQLLALPMGTILRYDYQEKYFSQEAFSFLRQLKETDCPIDVVLFYGQFPDFKKGDADPKGRILDVDHSILIPTRYARLRNVAFEERQGGAGESRTIVYFHMELKGFPDPDADAIKPLLNMLAAKAELPFEKWVALAPEDADLEPFRKTDAVLWGKVVDRLAIAPSQFHGDVFWRVDHLEKQTGSGHQTIYPVARPGNRFGDQEYFSDYRLEPLASYRVTIANFVPGEAGPDVPDQAAVTIAGDDTELLTIPETRREFRRNASSQFKLAVKPSYELKPRHIRLSLKTAVPNHLGAYTPGSVAEISLVAQISGYMVSAASGLAVVAAGGLAGATAFIKSGDMAPAAVCTMASVFAGALCALLLTGKFKLPGMGKD